MLTSFGAIAFFVSLLGGIHDLLTRRIPNWLTFPAMLAALAAQGWYFGVGGLANGVLGLALGFVLYFPIHALGHMGAGDVKLLMAVGAWLGWRDCVSVAVGAILLGAAFAFGEILWRGRLLVVCANTYSFLRALFVPGLVAEKLKVDESRKFAFGLCVAGAVVGLIYLRQSGRMP